MNWLMTHHLIKPCALAYLNQWHKTDRGILKRLSEADSSTDLAKAIQSLAAKYQVARNFPTKAIEIAHGKECVMERWMQVGQAVKAAQLPDYDHSRVIHELADKLGTIFHMKDMSKARPTLISAATKFLWFQGHSAIRIYDKRAVDALNLMQKERVQSNRKKGWKVDRNYELYARAWQQEYLAHESQIIMAIEQLPRNFDWSIIPIGEERSKALAEMKTVRFRERVFDKFLWTIGEIEKGDIE